MAQGERFAVEYTAGTFENAQQVRGQPVWTQAQAQDLAKLLAGLGVPFRAAPAVTEGGVNSNG